MEFSISRMVLLLCLPIVFAAMSNAQAVWAQDSNSSETAGAGSDALSSIYQDIPQFGRPSSVGGQLAEDAAVVPQFRLQTVRDFFDPWYRFNERTNDHCGLQFNIDESMFYQVATDSPREGDAASFGGFRRIPANG